jgi:hypothetical protein
MIGFKMVIKSAIGIVIVIVLLAVSCPDEDSFGRWAKKSFVGESESEVKKAKGKALATQANWTADYEGYVLWASVEAYQGGTKHRYLGALWMWIDLGEL